MEKNFSAIYDLMRENTKGISENTRITEEHIHDSRYLHDDVKEIKGLVVFCNSRKANQNGNSFKEADNGKA